VTPLRQDARPVTPIRGTATQDRVLAPLPWWQRHRRVLVASGLVLVVLALLAVPALRALRNGERAVPAADRRLELHGAAAKQAKEQAATCAASHDVVLAQQCLSNALHDAEGSSFGFAGTVSFVMGLHL